MKHRLFKTALLISYMALLSISDSCAQHNINNMEKFDLDFFNKHRKNSYSDYIYTENDTIIIIQDLGDVYKIIKQPKNLPCSFFKIYYKPSLTLKLKGQSFYNGSTGIWEYYDKAGNITKTVDKEASFPFSFDDLARVMKANYDIDIMNYRIHELDARRDTDPYPNYQVIDYVNNMGYEFNAITGELISITDGNTGIIKQYSSTPKSNKDLSYNQSAGKGFWSSIFE